MTEIDNALDGALWAAKRGWAVHPCNGKIPRTRWADEASTDPGQIAAWLAGTSLNYGIACGPSGLLVLDDDTGDALADYAVSMGREVPDTFTVITGRGLHYYFEAPARPIGNGRGRLPEKVDVRGVGGYVIGPGSVHSNGAPYAIANADAPVAPLPAWLLDVLVGRERGTASQRQPSVDLDEHTGPIPVGQRHAKLLSYAGHLRMRGFTRDEAKKLVSFRLKDCEQPEGDPFTEDDAADLVDDSFDRWDAPETEEERFQRDVTSEARRLRVLDAARAIVRRESEPEAPPMDACLLDDIPDEEARYRAEGLIPWEGNVLVVAKRKTGKTTWMHNLTASLRTGEPFLGSLAVSEPITGRVGFLNYELPRGLFKRWAHDVGLTSEDLYTVHLRNRRNPLAHDGDLVTLTRLLAEHDVEVLMVDPLSRAFVGDNINDTTQMTRFLASLDHLKSAIGAQHVILAAHAGWNGDRARNSSVVEDWADSIVTLTRGKVDEEQRFISAIGRDVELAEDRLDWDPVRRRLSLSGQGNRASLADQARVSELADALVRIVEAEPGLAVTEIEERLRRLGFGLRKGDASRAAIYAEGLGRILREKKGRRVEHLPSNMPQHAPKYPEGVHDIPRPALSRAGYVEGSSELTYPRHENAVETAALLLGAEVVA